MKSSIILLVVFACYIQNSFGQALGFGSGLGFNGIGIQNGLVNSGLGLPNSFAGSALPSFAPANNFGINNLPANIPGNFGAPCIGNGFGNYPSNVALNGLAANNIAANSALANMPLAGAPGLPIPAPVGYGDIAILGELPVGGNTAVSGNVPVVGYVTFEGVLPAGGLVSVANGCGCAKSY